MIPETEHYTNLVLGSEEAAKYTAWTLAKAIFTHRAMAEGLASLVPMSESGA